MPYRAAVPDLKGMAAFLSRLMREQQCSTSIRRWIRFVKPSIGAIYVTIHVTVSFWCSERQRK